jgi:hypothetical protein
MKIIIQMTPEEFDELVQKYSFKSRKEMARHLENTYNGGEPCDAVQIIDEGNYECYVYKSGDEYLGK